MRDAQAEPTDVAILGLGPVGATLALLLARQGATVRVIEREAAPYPLPRAVHFDEEAMRVFQGVGLADAILPDTRVSPGMRFEAPDGSVLMDWPRPAGRGPQGWNASYRFHQPALEATLRRALAREPRVAVELGNPATTLEEAGNSVRIGTAGGLRQARFAVGCDGANSLTRATIGSGMEDLGFAERWLVVDVILRRPCPQLGEVSIQFCDPRRPATYVRGVGDRRRFEVTLHPDEAPTGRMEPEEVWPLLARWIGPEDATLERHAVYTFRSQVAERWRRGRVLIAGDAAHLTPPFLGQGLCAGLRDAANLAWKLRRVLDGADQGLLDTYQAERAPHVRSYIELAVRVGGLINTRAMAAALGREPEAGPVEMRTPAPVLGGFAAPCGRPGPQPELADGTRLDDRVGHRFAVLLRADATPAAPLMDALAEAGAVLVADPALDAWLAEAGAAAALIRPDRYVESLAPDASGVAAFLPHLRRWNPRCA